MDERTDKQTGIQVDKLANKLRGKPMEQINQIKG